MAAEHREFPADCGHGDLCFLASIYRGWPRWLLDTVRSLSIVVTVTCAPSLHLRRQVMTAVGAALWVQHCRQHSRRVQQDLAERFATKVFLCMQPLAYHCSWRLPAPYAVVFVAGPTSSSRQNRYLLLHHRWF
jgi:hypothetical protein